MISPKLIFFDMEGTIFKKAVKLSDTLVAPSAWVAIAKSISEEAYQEEIGTQEYWQRGEYSSYIAWMEDTIKIHKKYGLKQAAFEKIIGKIDFMPGVRTVFETLQGKQIKTALVTGGFKFQADRAVKELKINHAYAACEYFWDEDGNLLHWNLLPADYDGKLEFMGLLSTEYGFAREQTAFVGDGVNDCGLAQSVGTSIAFNAAEELAKICTYSINQKKGEEDFTEILKYLGI